MQSLQRHEALPSKTSRAPMPLAGTGSPLRGQLRAATYDEGAALLALAPEVQRKPSSKSGHAGAQASQEVPAASPDASGIEGTIQDIAMGCDAMLALLSQEQAAAIARVDIAQAGRLAEISHAVGRFGELLGTVMVASDLAEAATQFRAMQAHFSAARSSGSATEQLDGYLAARQSSRRVITCRLPYRIARFAQRPSSSLRPSQGSPHEVDHAVRRGSRVRPPRGFGRSHRWLWRRR